MEPEISRPSEPGLGRLLRRRARAKRLSRAYQGKEFRSWGEYAPKTLQTTGDHSHASRWGFIFIFFVAMVAGPAIFGARELAASDYDGTPLLVRIGLFARFIAPFLIFAGVLLALLGCLRLGVYIIVAHQARRDRGQ